MKQLRRLAGLNLVKNSSGEHRSKTKISKRGRPYLRHMLYMAGVSCVLHNAEMCQYYQYLRKRRTNPLKKMQALVATGLKVMRVLFYMLKNREKYNPEKALGDIRRGKHAFSIRLRASIQVTASRPISVQGWTKECQGRYCGFHSYFSLTQ